MHVTHLAIVAVVALHSTAQAWTTTTTTTSTSMRTAATVRRTTTALNVLSEGRTDEEIATERRKQQQQQQQQQQQKQQNHWRHHQNHLQHHVNGNDGSSSYDDDHLDVHHEQQQNQMNHHHIDFEKRDVDDDGEDSDNVENKPALQIPQVQFQLPPRWVPNVAWQHHHEATTRFVHERRARNIKNNKLNHRRETSATGTATPTGATKTSDYDDSRPVVVEPPSQDNDASVNTYDDDPRLAKLVSRTKEWKALEDHAKWMELNVQTGTTHLRTLLQDVRRCNALYAEHDGVYLDYSRQRVTETTMKLLVDLADRQNLRQRIQDMVSGKIINFTEKRAVLHTALRANRDDPPVMVGDTDVNAIDEVYQVLDQVKTFAEGVRSGEIRGYTGKRLRNIVSVGIGGSYLGPEFLHEVLKTEPEGVKQAKGYSLRFLANVDPVDVERACANLDPEETLVVVVSKTFTTAETMLNARAMRQWLWGAMGNDSAVVQKHMVACASLSSKDKVEAFGIDTKRHFFNFWDWVCGRYSVCSAAGAVPISLVYGYDVFEKFLKGANSMDRHLVEAPLDRNIPVLMGLLGVWNMSFLNYPTRTIAPYAESLLKLPAHIMQVDMESNGKAMTTHGVPVDYPVGEIDFGEPGTNGQHSFFQLLHMGQTVPCDFIGFVQSQNDMHLEDENLSSHDQLMANFFSQPDALANGRSAEEVRAAGGTDDEDLISHRTFQGNRPSLSLLFPKLTAYATGQLLALYEHRTAVQGFLWDINSFDQWGVELGKKLALDVKDHLYEARQTGEEIKNAGNPASTRILNYYVKSNHDENSSLSSPATSADSERSEQKKDTPSS